MSTTQNPEAWVKANCPVPVEDRWCPVTIFRLVQAEPGIREVRYDTSNREMQIDYDPQQLTGKQAQSIADKLARSIEQQVSPLRDRTRMSAEHSCRISLQQLQRRADEKPARVVDTDHTGDCTARTLIGNDTIEISNGVMRVSQQRTQRRASPWVTRKIRIDGLDSEAPSGEARTSCYSASGAAADDVSAPAVTATAGQAAATAIRAVLSGAQRRLGRVSLEPLFVAITLVTMVAGAVSERTGPPGLSWVFYALAYLSGGYFGVQAGYASLSARRIDIDLLMILAAIGAAAVGAPFEGALLLFLFSLSNVLQDYALDRTRSAIRALSKLRPDTAIVLDTPQSEQGRTLPVNDIAIGAFLQVRPGDRIALDGVVYSGGSSVDQSSITGESMPVEKSPGQDVLAGSFNQDGELVIRVTKTSDESTIAKVITLVEDAREQQAKTERFLDRFEQYYAMGVIAATILAGVLPPYLFGTEWSLSVYRAITLMVAASPCALIISTPASILSSIGNGARRGILFKGGVHVEQAAGIQAVAFDKTGTLTEGKPYVADVVSLCGKSEDELLALAASLESKSEHVLARAITTEAQTRGLQYGSPTQFRSESGVGIRGRFNGAEFRIGSPAVFNEFSENDPELAAANEEVARLQREAKTVVVLLEELGSTPAGNGAGTSAKRRIMGLIALEDRLRPGVREVVQDLHDAGIKHVAMLTGDNAAAAQQIAAQAGIDVVFPELLPENKLDAIRRIEAEYGPTAMVGDGVNDAPALAGARLGIAMGAAGTDVALETADVVLLSDDLEKVPYLIALSRRTKRTLAVNIAVALSLIALMVVGIYTIDLPLPLAVVGHEGGTVLVSLNGVRLLMFKRSGRRHARPAGGSESPGPAMRQT